MHRSLVLPRTGRPFARAFIAGLVLTGCGDSTDPAPTTDTTEIGDAASDTTPATDTAPTPDGTTPDSTTPDTTPPDDAVNPSDVTTPDDTTVLPSCDPAARPFGRTDSDATPGPVHHICAPEHLDAIRTAPTARFVLDGDIDLTGTRWAPITEFQGHLDGNNHAIIGLNLDCADGATDGVLLPNCAFMRFVTNGGTLTNLRFTKVTTTIRPNGGTVVGQLKSAWESDLGKAATDSATLENVHVSGHVSVIGDTSGGVMRLSNGKAVVRNVSFDGTLLRHATPLQTNDANVGGIAWRLAGDSDVRDIAFRGDIIGHGGLYIAGIAGYVLNQASLVGCAVDADIRGAQHVAGVANVQRTTGQVSSCRVVGKIHGKNRPGVAGLVGDLATGLLAHSYVSASVTSGDEAVDATPDVWTSNDAASHTGLLYNDELNAQDPLLAAAVSTATLHNPDATVFEDYPAPPWVLVAGALPTLAFEASIPVLTDLDTFACGGGALTCKRGVEACEEIIPDCAPSSFRCIADGGALSILGCVSDADDACACIARSEMEQTTCDVGEDGTVMLSRHVACENHAE